jgi:pimeloyl-ACP methyl ester carboxylesterase
MTRKTLDTAQAQLVFDEYGPTDANDTVVLLHGGAQTGRAWREVATMLATHGIRSICPDLRGHGESSWSSTGDYSAPAVRGDLIALIDAVGPPVHLVGASLGGLISILTTAARPDLVRSLTLVDVVAKNSRAGEDRVRSFLSARPDGFESLDEVAEAISTYQSHRKRPADNSGLSPYVRARADGRLVWHWDPAFLLKDGLPWTRRRMAALNSAARGITVPTLLVLGGLSDVVDRESLDGFIAQVPHAEVSTIDGAHHMVSGDRNDKFGAEILRFVTEQAVSQQRR